MPCFRFKTIATLTDLIYLRKHLQLLLTTFIKKNSKNSLYFFITITVFLFCSVSVAQINNIALRKPAVALSEEGPGNSAAKAVDGNSKTRWASSWSDPQWIYIDLGSPRTINRVVLNWEVAYAKAYQIQVSNDKTDWITAYSTTDGNGDMDDINLTATGRYIRLYATARVTQYGYSLWSFEVFASTNTTLPPPSSVNKALNKPIFASSEESTIWSAAQAVDGNEKTRWASNWNDAQWIYVDLGMEQTISKVVLKWEWAAARQYQIQISNDKKNWETLNTLNDSDGEIDEIPVSGTGRYVRVLGIKRATTYGYSLWSFEVY